MSKDNNENINKINKCNHENCSKKIRLSDFPCKCKNVYCKIHRMPEDHCCEYDYKSPDSKQKRITELECRSTKIQKIN